MATTGEIQINEESDLISVRKTAREISNQIGFKLIDVTRILTAVSELARNIYKYAKTGIMYWRIIYERNRKGLEFVFEDHGPGIKDVQLVLMGGYSSGKGLGLGISGSKKLMDSLEIQTELGKGTKITIIKWLRE